MRVHAQRRSDRLFPVFPCMNWLVKIPFWASLAFYGADEYREAFDIALDSYFEAFYAAEVVHRSHLSTNQS